MCHQPWISGCSSPHPPLGHPAQTHCGWEHADGAHSLEFSTISGDISSDKQRVFKVFPSPGGPCQPYWLLQRQVTRQRQPKAPGVRLVCAQCVLRRFASPSELRPVSQPPSLCQPVNPSKRWDFPQSPAYFQEINDRITASLGPPAIPAATRKQQHRLG